MTRNNSPLLEAALGYARMGIPVFPCLPGRKKPITENGFHDASTDEAVIRQWWTDNPRANIGMPTGAASGNIVIDIDPRHGGHVSLDVLTDEHGDLPDTPESATSGGGRHFYFQHPGRHVPCSQGVIAPGVDVKGDGGYVMLPPSIHPDGKTYTWELSSVLGEVSPVLPPQWLLAKLGQSDAPSQQGPTCGDSGEASDGNTIPEGQRNNALASLAGSMRRNGMSRDEILAALMVTNSNRCDPPLSEKEVQRIADSVSRYQPDAVSVALVENHYEQQFGQEEEPSTNAIINPGPFPEHLLHDLPDIVQMAMEYYTTNAIEVLPVMFLASFIAATGTILGHKVKDASGLRTNIYTVGALGTGGGKEATREMVDRIFQRAGLAPMCGAEDFASDSGMIKAVSIQNPILFQIDEFGRLLHSIQLGTKNSPHLYNIASALLKFYSKANGTYRSKAYADAKRNMRINYPHVCVYGTTVVDNLWDSLSFEAVKDGFLPRLMIFEACSHNIAGLKQETDPPRELVDYFRYWSNRCITGGNIESVHPYAMVVPYSPQASQIMQDFRDEQKHEMAQHDELGPLWSRARENAGKIALIHACWKNAEQPIVESDSANWAVQVTRHVVRQTLWRANLSLVDNPFHGECQKVLRRLQAQPNGEILHSELLRRMKMKSREFRDLIETLEQRGDIQCVQQSTAGRPGVYYRLRSRGC